MSFTPHARQVRALYKGLLKLHRGLPYQLQAMGDQYVKDEFRRHKDVPKAEAEIFMTEWSKYYVHLAKQLAAKKRKQEIGQNLSSEFLDCFNDEQIAQLMELQKEASTRPPQTDS